MDFELQPILENETIKMIPLKNIDFEILYNIASDPLIWEQHPNKDRYKREVFENFFKGAIESKGAFLILDNKTNTPIGSSRYYDFDIDKSSIAIGYTFIARSHWGTGHNKAIKELMLKHAFKFVDNIIFHIGSNNIRSQKAISKIGANKIKEEEIAYYGEPSKLNYVYKINKNIKSLKNIDAKLLYKSFLKAFEDYEVNIKMTFEDFIEMIKTRSLNLEYSLGYFVENNIVAFIINGYREINSKRYCYDGGTGTIKEYRRKGIGDSLLKELISNLKDKKIDYFILEVLENNTSAIKLYEKYGFKKSRKLKCFEIEKNKLETYKESSFSIENNIEKIDKLNQENYVLYKPSWQNDYTSIKNVEEKYSAVIVSNNNLIIAYSFIHKLTDNIPQICILNEYKNKNIEEILINELSKKTSNNKIKMLNVEENNYLEYKLIDIGFENYINQYEMKLDLTN